MTNLFHYCCRYGRWPEFRRKPEITWLNTSASCTLNGSVLTGPERGKVDRLPILVSGQDVVKLLSVPKLQDGTAASMAQAITQTIDDWGLRDRIKGLCFDTTSSNTGTKNGTCIQLEEELGQQLVNLACRHHISEIILEKVFSIEDVSKSPNMELFGHFRDFWPRIDQKSFCTAAEPVRKFPMEIYEKNPWKNHGYLERVPMENS